MQDEEFASYYVAEKMKKLGFDEICIAYYSLPPVANEHGKFIPTTEDHFAGWNTYIDRFSAPLWQQAIEWLIKHGIFIDFRKRFGIKIDSNETYEYYTYEIYLNNNFVFGDYSANSKYEYVRERAVLEALNICQTLYDKLA